MPSRKTVNRSRPDMGGGHSAEVSLRQIVNGRTPRAFPSRPGGRGRAQAPATQSPIAARQSSLYQSTAMSKHDKCFCRTACRPASSRTFLSDDDTLPQRPLSKGFCPDCRRAEGNQARRVSRRPLAGRRRGTGPRQAPGAGRRGGRPGLGHSRRTIRRARALRWSTVRPNSLPRPT